MSHRLMIAVSISLFLAQIEAFAQQGRNSSSTLSGTQTSGSSAFGSGSSSAFGSSQLGSGTGTGLGSGTGTGTGLGTGSSFGSNSGQEGFLGRGDATEFLGRMAQGQSTGQNSGGRNSSTRNNRGANNTTSQFGGQGGFNFSPFGSGGLDTANSGPTNSQVRPVLQIAFDVPTVTIEISNQRITSRMVEVGARVPRLKGVQGIVTDGGVLTLRGSVKELKDRKLAEAMARLEPGVRKVVNELDVAE